MGYFNRCLYHSANKEHAKYGTVGSTSSEKGTDNKKNNTSQYNHDYYMKNKDKWSGGDGSKEEDTVKKLSDMSGREEEEYRNLIKIAKEKGYDDPEFKDLLDSLSEGDSAQYKKLETVIKNHVGTSKTTEKEFDVDAAARDVIKGKYKNGAERKAALGDDYAEVQKRVNELMKGQKSSSKKTEEKKEESAPETKKDNELRTYEQAREDYNKKKKNLSHSDDLGSVLVRDLY